MKSKIKYLLIFLPVVVAVFACLACGGKSENHTHTYATELSHDDEYHWYAATCEHTGKESGKSVHVFTVTDSKEATCTQNGYAVYTCACGYSYRAELTATDHTFAESVLAYDEISHWYPALCEHDDAKGSEQNHRFTNGNACVCGYAYDAMDASDFKLTLSGATYIVEGFSDTAQDTTEIRLPATYGGRAITAVKENAFEGNEGLTRVILPSSVITIGREAFSGCTNLVSVSLGEGTRTIEETAFGGCTSLKEIVLPESVTNVGSYAFEGCASLTSVRFPAKLSTLGDQVFSHCTSLETVALPKGVTKLGDNLFYGCSALKEVSLPIGLESIGTQVFARCTSLENIQIPQSVSYIGMKAFKGSGLKEIVVPDSVSHIGAYAFADCVSLTSATISQNVTYTLGGWFSGCGALQSLTVPFVGNNVSYIDAIDTAFGFAFGTAAPAQSESEKFAQVTQGNAKYYLPKTLTHVTVLGGTIATRAFSGCSNITKITLASGVKERNNAFDGCNAEIERLS